MDVVAVVGLGYVGLPLAVAFGKIMPTIGYDLCLAKLDSYRRSIDPSGTVSAADLQAAEMRANGEDVFVHDPVADAGEAMQEYGMELVAWEALPKADAMVLAVAHRELLAQSAMRLSEKFKAGGCLVDEKGRAVAENLRDAGIYVWRL